MDCARDRITFHEQVRMIEKSNLHEMERLEAEKKDLGSLYTRGHIFHAARASGNKYPPNSASRGTRLPRVDDEQPITFDQYVGVCKAINI